MVTSSSKPIPHLSASSCSCSPRTARSRASLAIFSYGSGVGAAVGSAVGAAVGSAVGAVVGSAVGSAVGAVIGSAVGSVIGSAVGAAVGGTLGPSVGGTVEPGVGAAVGGTLGSGVGAAVGTGEGAGANVSTEMLSALAPAMPLLASSRRSSFAVAGSSFSPRIVAFAASARYARRRADERATIDAVKFPLETCHPQNSSRTHAFCVKQLIKCDAAARTGGVGDGHEHRTMTRATNEREREGTRARMGTSTAL